MLYLEKNHKSINHNHYNNIVIINRDTTPPSPSPPPQPQQQPQPPQPQQQPQKQHVTNQKKTSPVKIVKPSRPSRPADPIVPYIRTGYTPPKQTVQVIRNISPTQQQQQPVQYLQTYVQKSNSIIPPKRINKSPLTKQISPPQEKYYHPCYNINTPISAIHHSLTDINSLLMELSHYASDYPHYIAIKEIHGLINEITRQTIDERSYDRVYNTLLQEILAFRVYMYYL